MIKVLSWLKSIYSIKPIIFTTRRNAKQIIFFPIFWRLNENDFNEKNLSEIWCQLLFRRRLDLHLIKYFSYQKSNKKNVSKIFDRKISIKLFRSLLYSSTLFTNGWDLRAKKHSVDNPFNSISNKWTQVLPLFQRENVGIPMKGRVRISVGISWQ